jgi:hypothetical protein
MLKNKPKKRVTPTKVLKMVDALILAGEPKQSEEAIVKEHGDEEQKQSE